jgi:hypothetical protein
MKSKQVLLAVALAAITSTIASAKLGETVVESNARYHKQGTKFENSSAYGPFSMIWTVGDWNIEEWFDDGVCTIIQYGGTDNGWLTGAELSTLLANNGGSNWVKTTNPAQGTEWTDATDGLLARYYSCSMVPVKGNGRGVNKPVIRFATVKALSARGLIIDSDNDQPVDGGNNNNPPSLQSI